MDFEENSPDKLMDILEFFLSEHKKIINNSSVFDYKRIYDDEYEIITSTYPIHVTVWNQRYVFSVHFDSNIFEIAKQKNQSVEAVYKSLSLMRLVHSYSVDEDGTFYYSSVNYPPLNSQSMSHILINIFDAINVYNAHMRDWGDWEW